MWIVEELWIGGNRPHVCLCMVYLNNQMFSPDVHVKLTGQQLKPATVHQALHVIFFGKGRMPH